VQGTHNYWLVSNFFRSETEEQLDTTIGFEGRAKVEARLRQLEGGAFVKKGVLTAQKTAKYDAVAAKTAATAPAYNEASDIVLDDAKLEAKEDIDGVDEGESAKKKSKKEKKKKKSLDGEGKKSKKRKSDAVDHENGDDAEAKKAAKKAKKKEKRKSKE